MLERFESECTARTPSSPDWSTVVGIGRLAVGSAGELRVALVASDDDAALPCPRDDRGDAFGPHRRAGGVGGIVEPQDQTAFGVGRRDPFEVGKPVGVEWHRNRPQTREASAHLVGRVRDRRVEHGVTRRIPEVQHMGQRRHELLGADTRDHAVGIDTHVETPTDPRRRGLTQRRSSDRRRVARRRRGRVDERQPRDLGHRVDRGADGAVDDTTRHRVGEPTQRGEAVVRVGRGDEPGGRRLHTQISLTGHPEAADRRPRASDPVSA